jgi:hypothetical protein
LQGGTYVGYCSLNYVRDLCNITTSDLTDTELYSLVEKATVLVNQDLNTKVIRERIGYIDDTRENNINSSNTTYYVKNWKRKFIADSDNNALVNTSDIIVYQVASDGTETELTVSSITPNEGKFVLSSAPSSGVNLYVTYDYSPVSEYDPDENVKLACAYLTIALAWEKINRGMSPQQVYGNVKFMRDMRAGNDYFKTYENIISKINSEMGDYAEAPDINVGGAR